MKPSKQQSWQEQLGLPAGATVTSRSTKGNTVVISFDISGGRLAEAIKGTILSAAAPLSGGCMAGGERPFAPPPTCRTMGNDPDFRPAGSPQYTPPATTSEEEMDHAGQ